MMELNPDWVKVVSVKGELTEMNKAGLDMLEAPRLEDAHMQPLLNYVEPDYWGAFGELHQILSGASEEIPESPHDGHIWSDGQGRNP